ncbi:hypothetical protein VP01_1220g3 [Puccinia sorghi]|uniref:Uncharacterized protein n=1 Tax=Puccinia sorghi TaxID=27349 RepID=A0A0L6VRJ5_9BASI|nr:hypothetical protein VP01_1220g3 [Puccinia sorghi]
MVCMPFFLHPFHLVLCVALFGWNRFTSLFWLLNLQGCFLVDFSHVLSILKCCLGIIIHTQEVFNVSLYKLCNTKKKNLMTSSQIDGFASKSYERFNGPKLNLYRDTQSNIILALNAPYIKTGGIWSPKNRNIRLRSCAIAHGQHSFELTLMVQGHKRSVLPYAISPYCTGIMVAHLHAQYNHEKEEEGYHVVVNTEERLLWRGECIEQVWEGINMCYSVGGAEGGDSNYSLGWLIITHRNICRQLQGFTAFIAFSVTCTAVQPSLHCTWNVWPQCRHRKAIYASGCKGCIAIFQFLINESRLPIGLISPFPHPPIRVFPHLPVIIIIILVTGLSPWHLHASAFLLTWSYTELIPVVYEGGLNFCFQLISSTIQLQFFFKLIRKKPLAMIYRSPSMLLSFAANQVMAEVAPGAVWSLYRQGGNCGSQQ